jgi:hypothetical protein
MKRILLFTLVAVLAAAPVAALAHDKDRGHWHGHDKRYAAGYQHRKHASNRFEQRVERRQANQFQRIREGRRSGDLTREEAKRLKKQQYRIERKFDRYTRDGRLTKDERRRLAKAQDRASRSIAESRRNDDYRYRHGYRPNRQHYAQRDAFAVFWHYLN